MAGYSFTIDGREYDRFQDGRPFTLADCWREIEGCFNAHIWQGDRLVLRDAGSLRVRASIRTEIRSRAWDHRVWGTKARIAA